MILMADDDVVICRGPPPFRRREYIDPLSKLSRVVPTSSTGTPLPPHRYFEHRPAVVKAEQTADRNSTNRSERGTAW
jgi:hypothetical protein